MSLNIIDMFKNLDVTLAESNTGKEVSKYPFPCVHATDFEPISIIEPDLKSGPWIAGGAPLRWYQGQPVGDSDIDVFCRSPKQAMDLIERLKSYGRYTVKAESENAVTLDYWGPETSNFRWTIQIIRRRFFNNYEEIIKNFDITVCQIVTDGTYIELGEYTARDIREKNLRMSQPLHDDAVKRLTKYWVYGYRPVDGLIDAIVKNPTGRWAFNPSEDYNDAL